MKKKLLPPVKVQSPPKILPAGKEDVIRQRRLLFSFSHFDRDHVLFNLGANTQSGNVGEEWFLDLLDCLKRVSNLSFEDLKASTHQMHPVDWKNVNMRPPKNMEPSEFWQFRISKSKGRVFGIKVDNIFYIVWLDRYHNFCDSPGYPGIQEFNRPKSLYEKQEEKIADLEQRIKKLEQEIVDYENLLKE